VSKRILLRNERPRRPAPPTSLGEGRRERICFGAHGDGPPRIIILKRPAQAMPTRCLERFRGPTRAACSSTVKELQTALARRHQKTGPCVVPAIRQRLKTLQCGLSRSTSQAAGRRYHEHPKGDPSPKSLDFLFEPSRHLRTEAWSSAMIPGRNRKALRVLCE